MNGSHHTHTTPLSGQLPCDAMATTIINASTILPPPVHQHVRDYDNDQRPSSHTQPPPLRDSHYIKPWSPPLSTHPPTIARLNGARPEPQIMYVFLSFFSLFFRLLMIFLHLDYTCTGSMKTMNGPHIAHTIPSRDSHHIIPCTITLHHGTTIVNVSTPTRKLTKKKTGIRTCVWGMGT